MEQIWNKSMNDWEKFKSYVKLALAEGVFFLWVGVFIAIVSVVIGVLNRLFKWNVTNEYAIKVFTDHVPFTSISFLFIAMFLIISIVPFLPERAFKENLLLNIKSLYTKLFGFCAISSSIIIGMSIVICIEGIFLFLTGNGVTNFVLLFLFAIMALFLLTLPFITELCIEDVEEESTTFKKFRHGSTLLIIGAISYVISIYTAMPVEITVKYTQEELEFIKKTSSDKNISMEDYVKRKSLEGME